MKRLARPDARYRADLAVVLRKSEATRYATTVHHAVALAQRYTRLSPELHTFRSTVQHPSVRDFFIGLYENPRVAVRRILQRTRKSLDRVTTAHCQYCGFPRPDTLDHYLEKSAICELAIFAPNLVPCCRPCNNLKGAPFHSDGRRRILHFYDDDVERMPEVLVARVGVKRGDVVAEFEVASSTHPLVSVYREHFGALRLAERYGTESALLVAEIHRALHRGRQPSAARIIAELHGRAADASAIYGPNDFRAALYRALAGSPTVVARLRRSTP